jgi:acetolactate synthase-1/3 small subunit
MEWMFLLTAFNRPRVESRLMQVLDHHAVTLHAFSAIRSGDELRISFISPLDRAGALRTAHLLRKLHDVQSVDVFESADGLCRTLALFKVLCDQESRLPLLQVIGSLGAQVVAIRPDSVAFQIVGTLADIEGLRSSLMPYGLVEAMSVASAIVRKQPAAPGVSAVSHCMEELDEPLPISSAINRGPVSTKSVATLKKNPLPRPSPLLA